MEQLSLCFITENLLHRPNGSWNYEIVYAFSLNQAHEMFRKHLIFCLILPPSFKGTNTITFIEGFRQHFPKIPTILYGKEIYRKNDLTDHVQTGLIFTPATNIKIALKKAEQILNETSFDLDVKQVWRGIRSDQSVWTQKITKYLLNDQNFLHINYVSQIAYHFGVCEAYLSRVFNNNSIVTLKQLLLSLKLCYAGYLRERTTLKIKDIAEYCGLRDGHHLSRLFYQKVGIHLSHYPFAHSWQEVINKCCEAIKKKTTAEKNNVKKCPSCQKMPLTKRG